MILLKRTNQIGQGELEVGRGGDTDLGGGGWL